MFRKPLWFNHDSNNYSNGSGIQTNSDPIEITLDSGLKLYISDIINLGDEQIALIAAENPTIFVPFVYKDGEIQDNIIDESVLNIDSD